MAILKEVKEKELYRVEYNVPIKVKEQLDLLIEDKIGGDYRACLLDDTGEETDGYIKGYVELEFSSDYPYNESFLKEVVQDFDDLENEVVTDVVLNPDTDIVEEDTCTNNCKNCKKLISNNFTDKNMLCRCSDCFALTEKDDTWYCDVYNTECSNVDNCKEWE